MRTETLTPCGCDLHRAFRDRDYHADGFTDEQLLAVAEDLQARFGDREPTPAEVHVVLNAELTRVEREAELARREQPWYAAAAGRVARPVYPTLHWRAVLDFERQVPGQATGGKVRAIRRTFNVPASIYVQQLHRIVGTSYAQAYAPDVCDEITRRIESYRARRVGAGVTA